MNTILTRVNAGASASFRLLHISDTHLTLADERNDQRKIKLAEDRSKYFPKAEQYLNEACKMAKKGNMTIAHTGDLIDFVSEANLVQRNLQTITMCFLQSEIMNFRFMSAKPSRMRHTEIRALHTYRSLSRMTFASV